MEKKTVNINVRLSEDLKKKLDAAAERRERPYAFMVRRFIIAGLRRTGQGKSREIGQTDVLQRETA